MTSLRSTVKCTPIRLLSCTARPKTQFHDTRTLASDEPGTDRSIVDADRYFGIDSRHVKCTSPHKAMAQSSYTFEDLSGSVMSSSSNPYDGLLEACHHDPVGRQPFAEAFTNRIARRRSRLGIRFTEKRENRNRKQSCCLRSSQASQRIRFCTDSKPSQGL